MFGGLGVWAATTQLAGAVVGAGTVVVEGNLKKVQHPTGGSSAQTQNRDGRGWMVGPYVSARVTRNIFFDARAAWGQSTNHVDPLGAYTDTSSTNRALASAKLTGDWTMSAFRFRPSAEVIYFTERQKDYVNAIGIGIAEQTVTLGRAVFGPEIGYRMQMPGKAMLEPFVGFKGVWDSSRTQGASVAGQPAF